MGRKPELPDSLQKEINALLDRAGEAYRAGELILQSLGIGAVGSAAAAGIAEGSKTGSLRAGFDRFGRRVLGQGPLLEEVQRRVGNRVTPARAGIVGAVVVIGGTLAYHNALEQQEQIREIIMHRFQEGNVADAQFRDVFGDRIDPANLKKYWEL